MIDTAVVRKLMELRADGPAVLSVYLAVPLAPDELRGLGARLDGLAGRAGIGGAGGARPASSRRAVPDPRDAAAIRDALTAHAHEWLGQTIGAFACRELGLFEIIRLPAGIPELAVAASRPYVRPMLAALQRSPEYVVTVLDHRKSWLFRVSAAGIETAGELEEDVVRSPRFGGWYGLEARRVHERILGLTRHHYRQTVAALGHVLDAGEGDLLVLAGHQDETANFLGMLAQPLRDAFAGSFVVDPHTMTPAKVHKLADEVVARWQEDRERRLAAEAAAAAGAGEAAAGGPAASGPAACLAAVNQRAIRSLIVPDRLLLPGFACGECGALAAGGAGCPVCGAEMSAVPDVIEELVVRVTEEGGNVQFIRDSRPELLAARLRFPVHRS